MKKAISFFDKYANEYDWLTNAEERAVAHRREVNALIERFRPDRVLDAGCATGLTTSLFAERGIETVGLDRSKEMLHQAKEKFLKTVLPVSFMHGSFEKLPARLNDSFDLVVCLANSIVGVGTNSNLNKTLRGFYRVLKPGGHLVLQSLNVNALKEGEILPVRTTARNGLIYSRFLERSSDSSVLYILRTDTRVTPPTTEFFRNESVSFTPQVLERAIARSKFVAIHRYSNLTLGNRFMVRSRDVVLTAMKPAFA